MGKDRTSEAVTDIVGHEYTQHRDSEGNKTGTSEEKRDFVEREYTQHYDKDGNKTGQTTHEGNGRNVHRK